MSDVKHTLDALLEEERASATLSAERLQSLREGLAAAITTLPPEGGSSSDGSSPNPGNTPSPGLGVSGASLGGLSKLAVATVFGAVIGGAGTYAVVSPHEEEAVNVPTVEVAQLQDEPEPVERNPPANTNTVAPEARDEPSVHEKRIAPDLGERPPRRDLSEERTLVDAARAALARGDAGAALSILQRHRRTFPRGELAEERDALRVVTLFRAEQRTEAHREAERFLRRHPRSLLAPMVRRAVQSDETHADDIRR